MPPRKKAASKAPAEAPDRTPKTRDQKRKALTAPPEEPEAKRAAPTEPRWWDVPRRSERSKPAPKNTTPAAPKKTAAPRARKPTKAQLAKQQREAEEAERKLREEEQAVSHEDTPSTQSAAVDGQAPGLPQQQDSQQVEQREQPLKEQTKAKSTRRARKAVLSEDDDEEKENPPAPKEEQKKKTNAPKNQTKEQQNWPEQRQMIPAKRFGGTRKTKAQLEKEAARREEASRKRSAATAGIGEEDERPSTKPRVLERDFHGDNPRYTQTETHNGENVARVTKVPGMIVGEAKVDGQVNYKVDLPSTANFDDSVKRRNTEQIRRVMHALAQKVSEDDLHTIQAFPTMVSFVLGPDRVERCLPLTDLESSGLIKKEIAEKTIDRPIILPTVAPKILKYYEYYKSAPYNILNIRDDSWTPDILTDMYALGILLDDVPFKDTVITTLARVLVKDGQENEFDYSIERIRPIFDTSNEHTAGRRLFIDIFAREGFMDLSNPTEWGPAFVAALSASAYALSPSPDNATWPVLISPGDICWKSGMDGDDKLLCHSYHEHHHLGLKCTYAKNIGRQLQAWATLVPTDGPGVVAEGNEEVSEANVDGWLDAVDADAEAGQDGGPEAGDAEPKAQVQAEKEVAHGTANNEAVNQPANQPASRLFSRRNRALVIDSDDDKDGAEANSAEPKGGEPSKKKVVRRTAAKKAVKQPPTQPVSRLFSSRNRRLVIDSDDDG
ncbi:hypothetical protein K490DRAFT_69290 [Saccharata proteae CBS 121410]|uniref:Uncharacterized protein n=1 Tax=Saccharata proteae CBS 121410 TaxID=1314787 RepID=A0A9P4HNU2_9PEZI|nr:hypothetical protein K490DRAFT_69290 [Saccharata proteae CBS 121410]